MSSLSEAFDVPYPLTDAGLNLQLPRLDIEDHAAWCAEIKAAEMPGKISRLPPGPPDVRFVLRNRIDTEEVPLERIGDMLYDPKGIAQFWHKSLAKMGMTDAAARAAVIRKIPPWRAQKIAMYLSGLLDAPRPLTKEEQARQDAEAAAKRANPLGGTGASESGATSTPGAGDTPGASSPSTPAESQSAA